jgi:hypothetical protein
MSLKIIHGGEGLMMIEEFILQWGQNFQLVTAKVINYLIAMEEEQIDFYC